MNHSSKSRHRDLPSTTQSHNQQDHPKIVHEHNCKENLGQRIDLQLKKSTSYTFSVLQPLQGIPFQEQNIQNQESRKLDLKIERDVKENMQENNESLGEEVSAQVRQSLMHFLRSNSQDISKEKEHLDTEEDVLNLASEVNLEFLSDESDEEGVTPKIERRKIFLVDLIHIDPTQLCQQNNETTNHEDKNSCEEQVQAPNNSQNKVKINISSLFNM
ncbi:unnamed protein product [Moneuplotes crassus]|uniref:Uncharacterized protein n=1 Tax=Euplotes crassus TaxID=5936 RepID=A0AAD2D175_EUPCR|nr:unnamed protein product [Moneuplotes crassus]